MNAEARLTVALFGEERSYATYYEMAEAAKQLREHVRILREALEEIGGTVISSRPQAVGQDAVRMRTIARAALGRTK